jgi:hypothetical protein
VQGEVEQKLQRMHVVTLSDGSELEQPPAFIQGHWFYDIVCLELVSSLDSLTSLLQELGWHDFFSPHGTRKGNDPRHRLRFLLDDCLG